MARRDRHDLVERAWPIQCRNTFAIAVSECTQIVLKTAARQSPGRGFDSHPLRCRAPVNAELEDAVGLPFRWYDVLVQLEEAGHGAPMNEVASRILASKSGLTRVIDRMEEAGLVRRERPGDDRRVVLVFITDEGLATLHAARRVHRDGIRRHFTEHLTEAELRTLARTLEKVRGHVRPLRPGRVTG